MRQKNNHLIITISCFVLLLILNGCGDSKQAPDPPHAKTALVLELCSALKSKNHQLALKKVQRLKIIEPENVSLENIKERLEDNKLNSTVQNLLNLGNISAAVDAVNEDVGERGQNSYMIGTLNQLRKLIEIKRLLDEILKAKSSKEIAINSARLNKVISSYPPAKPLSSFLNKKLNEIRNRLSLENRLGIEDLKADIDTEWVRCTPYLDTMMASLEVENKNDPEIINYKCAMLKSWQDEPLFELNNSGKEFIFLRKALLLKENAKKKVIYDAILSLSPNCFRNMLIKAIVLKLVGQSKQSSDLSQEIVDLLSLPQNISKKWYQMTPDSLFRSKNLNPFVLYPFLLYYVQVHETKDSVKKRSKILQNQVK